MNKYDRLSALMQHFQMNVAVSEPGTGNLIVFGDRLSNRPNGLEFWPRQQTAHSNKPSDQRLFEARADWGGTANPLIAALPEN